MILNMKQSDYYYTIPAIKLKVLKPACILFVCISVLYSLSLVSTPLLSNVMMLLYIIYTITTQNTDLDILNIGQFKTYTCLDKDPPYDSGVAVMGYLSRPFLRRMSFFYLPFGVHFDISRGKRVHTLHQKTEGARQPLPDRL